MLCRYNRKSRAPCPASRPRISPDHPTPHGGSSQRVHVAVSRTPGSSSPQKQCRPTVPKNSTGPGGNAETVRRAPYASPQPRRETADLLSHVGVSLGPTACWYPGRRKRAFAPPKGALRQCLKNGPIVRTTSASRGLPVIKFRKNRANPVVLNSLAPENQ